MIGRREALAVAAGTLWGLGVPGAWAPVSSLAGWAALGRSVEGAPIADGLRYLSAGALTASLAARWLGPDLIDAGVPEGAWLAAAWVATAALGRGILGAVVARAVARGWTPPVAFAIGEAAWAVLAPYALWLPLDPTLTLGLSPLWLAPAQLAGVAGLAGLWSWVAAGRHPRRAVVGLGLLAFAARPSSPASVGVEVAALQPAAGPEVTDNGDTRRALTEALEALAATTRADVLVGPESSWHATDRAWPDPRPTLIGMPGERRQSAVLWIDGAARARVDKQRPTPATERAVLNIGHDRLAAADGARTVPVGGGPVGVLICGEDLAPGGVAAALTDDPTWLALLSNDSWSRSGQGARWHQAAAGRLAATSARPVVRAALNGPSAVFDARGRPLAQLDGGEIGAAVARIEPGVPTWCGEDVSWWLGVVGGLALLSPGWRPRGQRRSHA